MSKILVAYFSTRGATAAKAKLIAQSANADLYEIKPKEPYTDEDLDFKNKESRSSIENKDKSIRPELSDKDANIAQYDTIFLGYPIWWYSAPAIIKSFLESYDFSGKNIILFATSDSTGFGKSVKDLSESVSDTCTIKEGKMLTGTQYFGIAAWIRELGF